MRLNDVRGFVFDVDGTLVHRAGAEVRPLPGASEVLDAIRASKRPFALFTNGSHMPPAAFARELREAGLSVEDGQVLTPLCSMQTYLERHGDVAVLPFVTDSARGYLEEAGVRLVDDGEHEAVGAVFVAHPKEVDFESLERAARAVITGARLLTGSYVAAYAGANGPILSRGAMVTAAIAKASGRRPTIVGKPSRAAVAAVEMHLGMPERRSPWSATTSSWTSPSAIWAARGRCSYAVGSADRSMSAASRRGAGPTSRSGRGRPARPPLASAVENAGERRGQLALAFVLRLARPPGDEAVGTDEHGTLGAGAVGLRERGRLDPVRCERSGLRRMTPDLGR